jgi:hypothetical protein
MFSRIVIMSSSSEIFLPHGPWKHISTIKYKDYVVLLYRNPQGFITTIITPRTGSQGSMVFGIRVVKPLLIISGNVVDFIKELRKQGIEATLISKVEPSFFGMFILVNSGTKFIDLNLRPEDIERGNYSEVAEKKIIEAFEEMYDKCEKLSRSVQLYSTNYNVVLRDISAEEGINIDEYIVKLINEPYFIDEIAGLGELQEKTKKKEQLYSPTPVFRVSFLYPEKYIKGELLPIGFRRTGEPVILDLDKFKHELSIIVGRESAYLKFSKILAEDLVGIKKSVILVTFNKYHFSLFTEKRNRTPEEAQKLDKLEINILTAPPTLVFNPLNERGLPLKFRLDYLTPEIILELLGLNEKELRFILRDALVWIKSSSIPVDSIDKFVNAINQYIDYKAWHRRVGYSKIYQLKRFLTTVIRSKKFILSFSGTGFIPYKETVNIVDLTSDELSKLEKSSIVFALLEFLSELTKIRKDIALILDYRNIITLDDYLSSKIELMLTNLAKQIPVFLYIGEHYANISRFLAKHIKTRIDLINDKEAAIIIKDMPLVRFWIRPSITGDTIPSDELINSLTHKLAGNYVP